MIREIVGEVSAAGRDLQVRQPAIARAFHTALAQMMVAVARHVGEARIVLTGGCFQNRRLTETAIAGLGRAGFHVYWHQRIPPNDGGISLGQVIAAAAELRKQV
jgi:hydrogenase maturation protein HypF